MVGTDLELRGDFVGDHSAGAGFSIGHGETNRLSFANRSEEQGFQKTIVDDVL